MARTELDAASVACELDAASVAVTDEVDDGDVVVVVAGACLEEEEPVDDDMGAAGDSVRAVALQTVK